MLTTTILLMLAASEPISHSFQVGDIKREAIIYAPKAAKSTLSPVVFVFHGHGGSSAQAARSFRIEREWPEAVVVYPQGLPSAGRTDPQGTKAGWQVSINGLGGRDIKFFDAMLRWLKSEYNVDDRRIFATGHSNGGAMTCVLWGARGSQFAAFAPSSGYGLAHLQGPAKPVFTISGRKDQLVPFEGQMRSVTAMKRHNGASETGKTWENGCTWYSGANPVCTYIHGGGHQLPQNSGRLIVRFFKQVAANQSPR
jgi:polyhydroxybutyrate depolymerase